MRIKIGIYYFCLIFLVVASSCSSRKATFFQSKEKRKGRVVDIPSYRLESTVRFLPDDILGISVNVPGEPLVASDYNLPLVPLANTDNTSGAISTGVGRQTYLVTKDGTINFPVLGILKVAGYTQDELEKYLTDRLSEKLIAPTVVSVRLLNFNIYFAGEVGGRVPVSRDHINLLEALALGPGGLPLTAKHDDITIFRENPDGSYKRISVDISREDLISSPYYFLHQNDVIYIAPTKVKSQSADISPRYGFVLGVASLALTVWSWLKLIK